MAMTMKSFFKGLKTISQIFAHREHEMEMEIGNPTDVRHLSHVGLGTADACPSWMSEYRGMDQELSAGSVLQSRHTSWASLDFEQTPRATTTLPVEEQLYPADSSGAGQDPAAGAPNKNPPPHTTTTRKRNRKASRASSSSSFATALGDLSEPHPHGHGPAPLRTASCRASC